MREVSTVFSFFGGCCKFFFGMKLTKLSVIDILYSTRVHISGN